MNPHTSTPAADRQLLPLLLLLIVLTTLLATSAAAQDCTVIAQLPATIAAPGHYCLEGNQGVVLDSGIALEVAANNVSIDLGGYRIVNRAGMGTTAIGIRMLTRSNVTIRNGTVRGFYIGIQALGQGKGHVIEDIRAMKNSRLGLQIGGNHNIVRRNHVIDTGGSLANAPWTEAILAWGDHVRVEDNEVAGTFRTEPGDVYGISATSEGGIIARNDVTGTVTPDGERRPIFVHGATIIRDNNISGDGFAAIHYGGANGRPMCTDNRSLGYEQVLYQCPDGGGNVGLDP